MRALILLPLLAFASTALAADGERRAYCFRGEAALDADWMWRVDDGVDEALGAMTSAPTSFTHVEARQLVDIALQNLARQARPKIRATILDASVNCDSNVKGCVVAKADADDWFGCAVEPTRQAYATATPSIVLCSDHLAGQTFTPAVVVSLFEHEIGHVYKLQHPTPDDQGCSTVPRSGCSTTDGCEGEAMCATAGCRAAGFTDGDSRGVRAQYIGTDEWENRRFNTARFLLPGLSSHAHATTANIATAMFLPRIDCAISSAPTNTCATVYAWQDHITGNVVGRVRKLNNWAPNGWGSVALVGYTFSGVAFRMPPDIALNTTGTVAWVTTVTPSATNNVVLRRIDLVTNAHASVTLGYDTSLPPRVVTASSSSTRAYVLGAERTGGKNKWRMHQIDWDGTTFVTTSLDLGVLQDDQELARRNPVSDFDFDCYGTGCVLAAMLYDRERASSDRANAVQHRRITVNDGSVTLTDPTWLRDVDTFGWQSVIGVAMSCASGCNNANRLWLSGGRFSPSATSSRIAEYSPPGAATPTTSVIQKPDKPGICSTVTTSGGDALDAATMHGGTDLAWCPSCNGGSGTLESVHFGDTEVDDGVCF